MAEQTVITEDGSVGLLNTALTKRTSHVVMAAVAGLVTGTVISDIMNIDLLNKLKNNGSLSAEEEEALRRKLTEALSSCEEKDRLITQLRADLTSIVPEDGIHQSHLDAVNAAMASLQERFEGLQVALENSNAEGVRKAQRIAELERAATELNEARATIESLRKRLESIVPDDGITSTDLAEAQAAAQRKIDRMARRVVEAWASLRSKNTNVSAPAVSGSSSSEQLESALVAMREATVASSNVTRKSLAQERLQRIDQPLESNGLYSGLHSDIFSSTLRDSQWSFDDTSTKKIIFSRDNYPTFEPSFGFEGSEDANTWRRRTFATAFAFVTTAWEYRDADFDNPTFMRSLLLLSMVGRKCLAQLSSKHTFDNSIIREYGDILTCSAPTIYARGAADVLQRPVESLDDPIRQAEALATMLDDLGGRNWLKTLESAEVTRYPVELPVDLTERQLVNLFYYATLVISASAREVATAISKSRSSSSITFTGDWEGLFSGLKQARFTPSSMSNDD